MSIKTVIGYKICKVEFHPPSQKMLLQFNFQVNKHIGVRKKRFSVVSSFEVENFDLFHAFAFRIRNVHNVK